MNFPELQDTVSLPSPSLVVCPNRIEANIAHMIRIAGSPDRLRPHVKTHKMREVVSLQKARGIAKFKCATLSELRMLIDSDVEDILFAMQVTGPDVESLIDCAASHPDARISTLVDNPDSIAALESAIANRPNTRLGVYIDINNGMNRTGITPGDRALDLYRSLAQSRLLELRGLHVYDGHIRDEAISDRAAHCQADFQEVESLISKIESQDLAIPNMIIGGSPSFPAHADRNADLSPGTTLLWDFGYGEAFSDLPFEHAAALFTRVVSKPAPGLLCLDLGHKAVASEMEPPRVRIIGIEDATFVSHSEEHLVIATDKAVSISVGDGFFAIPKHICPTVALHNKAAIIRNGKIDAYWAIAARDRIL